MIDTDKYEGQIEFDYVLKEIEVGVDISEGNYDILRYYRDEYKDLLAEVQRLRERLIRAYDWAENAVNYNDSAMMDYTEYVCGGEEE